MSSMNDYLNNPMGFTQTYRPLPPFAMTQPEAIPSWMPAPVQRTAPYAAVPQPAAVQAALPTYGIGSTYGPDNIDAGGGFNLVSGGSSAPTSGGFMSGLKGWLKDSGFLGSKAADGMQTQGWGGLALGGAQALGSLYMGMQQYNLAKDTLANNKAQFERNFAAQKATTNASLEDRQRARVASNAGAYQSVGDYMQQNGVR